MSYTLLKETYPIARKQHRCVWCGERIEIGEKYTHEKSVYDGNMQDHKWHMECDKAAGEYFKSGEEEFDAGVNERPEERLGFPALPNVPVRQSPENINRKDTTK